MPSLRIHFSADDLARTRIAPGPDPLWELVLSLTILRSRQVAPQYAAWQRAASARLAGDAGSMSLRSLAELVPPVGGFPDFLTPSGGGGSQDLATALEEVAATPVARLRDDLAGAFARRPASAWVRDLASGARAPMRVLVAALRTYYDRILVPHRRHINTAVQADRALRARQLLDGGVEQLLASLPTSLQWIDRTLHAGYSYDRDIHLDGSGITLIPSYFCHRHPVTLIDDALPPVLVYPAFAGRDSPDDQPGALATLLGRTRAAALDELRIPCTTSELAHRLDISPGTASKHAAALREAGLLTTTRQGPAVLHALTPMGSALLTA